MVLTTVPTTALTVNAADQSVNVDADASKPADGQSGSDENQDGNVPDAPEDESNDEEKAAEAVKAVADAKSKAEAASAKAADAKIKQDALDAQTLLNDAKAELAKASADTEGYGDAQATIEAAERAVNEKISSNLPDELPDTPEGDGDQEDSQITTASLDVEPESMEATGVKVTVSQAETTESGTTYSDLRNADITFDNTVNEEGYANTKADYIAFKIRPEDGKRVERVRYAMGDKEEDLAAPDGTLTATGDGVYEVDMRVSALVERKYNVRIFVYLADVEYTVNITDGSGDTPTVILPGENGRLDFTSAGESLPKNNVKVKYGQTLTFAVKGLAGNKAEDASVEAVKSASGLEVIKLAGTSATGTDARITYVLDPSAVKGVTPIEDATIDVTLGKRTKPVLNPTNVTVSDKVDVTDVPSASSAGYKDLPAAKNGTDQATTYVEGDKIAFKAEVKAGEDDYVLLDPTAEWVESAGSHEKHTLVPRLTTQVINSVSQTFYVIDLSSVTAAGKLNVVIDAELNGAKDAVKKISFDKADHAKAAAGSNATINFDNVKNLLGTSVNTINDYDFVVKPDAGYWITEVKAVITKVYDDKTSKEETIVIDKEGYAYDEETAETPLYPIDRATALKLRAFGSDGAGLGWAAKNIRVSITTKPQPSLEGAAVTFVSTSNYMANKGAYKYTVNTEGGYVEKTADDTYSVKEGADYLEFTVSDAETAPTITVTDKDDTEVTNAAEPVSGKANTYRIPATKLDDDTEVVIARKSKTVTVRYKGATTFDGNIAVADKDESDVAIAVASEAADAAEGYTHKQAATVNVDANLLITVPQVTGRAPISKVSWKVGEKGTPTEVKPNNDGKYVFEAKATDDITVYVDKSGDRKIEVSSTTVPGGITPDGDGVYNVPNYQDVITAKVYEGETQADLYSVLVMDGDRKAATIAKVKGIAGSQYVEFTVDPSEYGSALTVILTLKDMSEEYFVIETGSEASGVTYDNPDVAGGTVTLPVDTEIVTGVEVAGKNVSAQSVGVTVLAADSTAKTIAGADASYNGVSAQYNDGELTITALPSDTTGKGGKSAKVVLYDAKAGTPYPVIENSAIVVTTADATVLGKAPVVKDMSTTARELRWNVSVPDDVNIDTVAGDVYYKVDMTVPAADKFKEIKDGNVTYTAAQVRAAVAEHVSNHLNGYYSVKDNKKVGAEQWITNLEVLPGELTVNGHTNVPIPAAAVDGFEVEVTLVQTNTSGTADGTIIVGGKTEKMSFGTKAPSYENTEKGQLKFKNGNTKINTGDRNWVAVAYPELSAAYNNVYVEFVDTQTGFEYSDQYCNLEVGYDPARNEVGVYTYRNRDGYEGSADDSYKNLGIKVTAVTEYGDYGVTGVIKLTVTNGIEKIDVDAQPYVLKEKGKVSFKADIDLNKTNATPERKYAPKSRKITCQIVGKDTTLNGAYNEPVRITAGPAGVTVNDSGSVTVDKDYVVDTRNADNNKFKILVKANDYAGNETYGLSDTIEITSNAQPLGTLAVMKKGSDWTKATWVSGQVEATQKTDEFRVVVFKNGEQPKAGRTYNVDTIGAYGNDTFVGYNSISLTPAKGNIEVDEDGNITINKLGKVTLSAVDKSSKKNKSTDTVEFVEKSGNMALQFTQLSDSQGNIVKTYPVDTTVKFSGNGTTLFGVNVVEVKENKELEILKVSNAKVSFGKNTKNVTPKSGAAEWARFGGEVYQYVIATTGDPSALTLQQKGRQKISYTLDNENEISGKAPRIALKDKRRKISPNTPTDITYTIQPADKNVSFEGMYVMLSLDNAKKNPEYAQYYFEKGGVEYLDRAVRIDNGDTFTIGMENQDPGSYYLNVAVGTLRNGVFSQQYKDAKLTVRVDRGVKVNVTGNYTIDPLVASMVPIKYNDNVTTAEFYDDFGHDSEHPESINHAMNAIIGNEPNHFRDYFMATEKKVGDNYYIDKIGLQDGVTPEQIAALTSRDSKDRVGYIRVTNGSSYVDVKITMTIKSSGKSLKAGASQVVTGSDMVADIIFENNKQAVKIKDYAVAGSISPFTADELLDPEPEGAVKQEDITAARGIRLRGSNIPKGSYKLNFLVWPANTPAAYKNNRTYAIEVPVTVKVVDTNTSNKIAFAKNANVWNVVNSDFVSPTGKEGDPVLGTWEKDLFYSFKSRPSMKEDAQIKVTADSKTASYVTLESDPYSVNKETQALRVVIDKSKLVAAGVKYGSKVTVKATFSYPGTALKDDTANITINLPKEPNKVSGSTLEGLLEATETDIQMMVNEKYAEYDGYVNDPEYTDKAYSDWNEDIRKSVENRVHAAAGDAAVTVKVTATKDGNNATNLLTTLANYYKVEVTGEDTKYEHLYVADATGEVGYKTVSEVITKIGTLFGTNWSGLDEVSSKLMTLTKDTTKEEYTEMIENVLRVDGFLTKNIKISIGDAEDDWVVDAPTTSHGGSIAIKVTVTDTSKAPSEGTAYQNETAVLTYTFAQIETADTAVSRVLTKLAENATAETIISNAWNKTAKEDMLPTDETFQDELETQIVAEANKLIEEGVVDEGTPANDRLNNSEVKAVRVVKDSLTFTATDDAVSTFSYKLVLSKGTEEVTKSVATDPIASVEAFQTVAQWGTAIAAANLTVSGAITTEEEAIAAVREKILSSSVKKNPALGAGTLTVKAATGGADFVKPVGKTNGLISVNVAYEGTGNYSTNIDAKDVRNIVILADGNKEFADDEDAETTGKTAEFKRVEAMLQAALSNTVLQKMLVDMQTAYAKVEDASAVDSTKAINGAAVAKAIAELVGGADGTQGYLANTGYKLATIPGSPDLSENIEGITDDTFSKPDSARNGKFIPKFTISIIKDELGATAKTVTIERVTLDAMPEFQNITEAGNELNRAIARNEMTLDCYADDLKLADPATNGFTDSDDFIEAVKNALKDVVTNKQLTLTPDLTNAEYEDPATGNYEYIVKGMTLKLHDKADAADTANDIEKTVTVNILKKTATEAATSITFKEVNFDGTNHLTGEVDGTTAHPVEEVIEGNTVQMDAEVVMTDDKFKADNQKIEWTVEAVKDDYADYADGEAAVKAARIKGVTIDDTGRVKIGDEARSFAHDDRNLYLKVTATAVTKGLNGATVSKSVYLKLGLKSKIDRVKITGEDVIEVNASNAGSGSGVDYTAEIEGAYVHEDDAANYITWTVTKENGDPVTGVTLTPSGATPGATCNVKITDAADILGTENSGTIKLTATVGVDANGIIPTGSPKVVDKIITIRKNTADAPKLVLSNVDGAEIVRNGLTVADTSYDKIVVSGDTVKIPMEIDANASMTGRTWTYTVEKVDGPGITTGISHEASSGGKYHYLKIDSSVAEISDKKAASGDDPAVDPTRIKITATADASGSKAGITVEKICGIVVEKKISGMAIWQYEDATGSGRLDEDDTKPIEAYAADDAVTSLFLMGHLTGAHIPEAEQNSSANVTYRIANQSAGLGAKITATAANAATITIPVAEAPYTHVGKTIIVEATYKKGDITVKGTRKINLKDSGDILKITAATHTSLSGAADPVNVMTIDAVNTTGGGSFTRRYSVVKGDGANSTETYAWSFDETDADYTTLGEALAVDENTGEVTVTVGDDKIPVAGDYHVTLIATDSTNNKTVKLPITIRAKKIITGFTIKRCDVANNEDALEDVKVTNGSGTVIDGAIVARNSAGYSVQIDSTKTAGNYLNFKVVLEGERLTAEDCEYLKWKTTDKGTVGVGTKEGEFVGSVADGIVSGVGKISLSKEDGSALEGDATPANAIVQVEVSLADEVGDDAILAGSPTITPATGKFDFRIKVVSP